MAITGDSKEVVADVVKTGMWALNIMGSILSASGVEADILEINDDVPIAPVRLCTDILEIVVECRKELTIALCNLAKEVPV